MSALNAVRARAVVSISGVLVSALGLLAGPALAGQALVAHRAEASPQVDGKLDEPCWGAAAQATGFVQLQSGKPALQQTTGQVVWDGERVYLGIRAEEPRMDLVRAAAGQATGKLDYERGETIEVFIGATGNRQDFLQVLVNTDGAWETWTTDPMHVRNVRLERAVHLGEDSFSMEIAIPFALLHLRPESGPTWALNLCRARLIEGRAEDIGPDPVYSSWRPTPGGFRQPQRFGDLEIAADLARYRLLVQPRFDAGTARLGLANHTGAACDLLLETTVGAGGPQSQPVTLAVGEAKEVPIPGEPGDELRLDVTLRDRATQQLLYVGGTALKERGPAVALEAGGPASARGYVVFTTSYLERGNQHTLPSAGELDRPLELFAAPGEFEPATFAIRPDRDLQAVAVAVKDDLAGPAGGTIPAVEVSIRAVERMKRWLSAAEYEPVECFLPRTTPRDLPAHRTQRYWLTVHVPPTTAPGVYEGQVRIAPAGAEPCLVPLRVEVPPVRLAPPEGMNYFMYFRLRDFVPELRTERLYLLCMEDMRDHGMTTNTLYAYPSGPGWLDLNRDSNDEMPMRRQIELMRQSGLLAPWSQVPWIGAECYGPDLWKLVQEAARQENWPEILFYFVDEPTEGRYERVDACMARVAEFRKAHPELSFRTTTAGAGNPRVSHYYDVWIGAAEAEIARARAEGKTAWDYDCGLAPVDAHTDRYYFGLWAWKSGIAGVSHWAYYDAGIMNRFDVPAPWRNSPEYLTEYTHNFNFVYPTPDELIPSIGWEAVREGVDDYRYLHTLRQTLETARAAGAKEDALRPAVALLDEVNRRIRSESRHEAMGRASAVSYGARLFERSPPQPEWTPAEYERLRRQCADQIAALNRAGYVYQPAWEPPAGRSVPAAGTSLPAPAAVSPTEALWEACDYLGKINVLYGQPCWRPKAFADALIGSLEISTQEKVEGTGSVHWRVSQADVAERLKVDPTFSQSSVMLNYLYGRDWSPYAELRFSIKCESPRHPPVYALLMGSKNPYRQILAQDEVTNGWKEIRWDLRAADLDIGRSEKWGMIMNYFRLFTHPGGGWREGVALDLYLDNMRLVAPAPKERQ